VFSGEKLMEGNENENNGASADTSSADNAAANDIGSFDGSVSAEAGPGPGAANEMSGMEGSNSSEVSATVGLDAPTMTFQTDLTDLGKIGGITAGAVISAMNLTAGRTSLGLTQAFGVVSTSIAAHQSFENVAHDVVSAAIVGSAVTQQAIGMQQLLGIGFQPF
jgi:hypothetical protein